VLVYIHGLGCSLGYFWTYNMLSSRRNFLRSAVGYIAAIFVPISLPERPFIWMSINGGPKHKVYIEPFGTSASRNALKDVFVSPEAMEELKNWKIYDGALN
jgi:hypothetical protein